jgi:hypothetical protein
VVDAARDPFGVEDVGAGQAAVVLEVEGRAQVVEEAGQRALRRFVLDAFLPAQVDVAFVGQVIFVQGGQLFFDGKPGERNPVVEMGQVVSVFDGWRSW